MAHKKAKFWQKNYCQRQKGGGGRMYYGTSKKNDIANGPGVRVCLFVSDWRHHCKGCFNAETWNFQYGQPYTKETEDEIIEALKPAYIQGFTLLGGEPFEPENKEELVKLLRRVRETYPEKNIWCYSGTCGMWIWCREARFTPKWQKRCGPVWMCWWMESLWKQRRIWPCSFAEAGIREF